MYATWFPHLKKTGATIEKIEVPMSMFVWVGSILPGRLDSTSTALDLGEGQTLNLWPIVYVRTTIRFSSGPFTLTQATLYFCKFTNDKIFAKIFLENYLSIWNHSHSKEWNQCSGLSNPNHCSITGNLSSKPAPKIVFGNQFVYIFLQC